MTRATTTSLLERLIAFDTTSCHANLSMIHFIKQYLEDYGVASKLVFDDTGRKANLYAIIGPQDKTGVMLSGHTDTVPVDGQVWTKPAFTLTQDGDRFYGRGTADMKGFLAVVLQAVPAMVQRKLRLPVHLAFSYDEEIGCIGVRRLIDVMNQQPSQPLCCIIGEPTSMDVVTAHKGKVALAVTVHGKACHSGLAPLGVNAISYAARLINWLDNKASDKQNNGPFEEGYDIPFTTVHVGKLSGGVALNIVPDHCSFSFEIRYINGDNPHQIIDDFMGYADELMREMHLVDPTCKIDTKIVTEYPGLKTTDRSNIIEFVQRLAGKNTMHKVNFGTEGGLFDTRLHIPTVVCGPGSMQQGHKPDEFITQRQLEDCELFIDRLLDELTE
ncbi:acetylornithine deacetylase [Grimontia sp. NTOU-MAR1]|uniref:acetylornithine deacetylase n=1 Tax=Grimontia sp. NTOU-MAR1 TaxID=3111011 RepID=UPI002DBD791A|nr:acetylornithine deacetylase [Grimontia sp. NTOU-MAR1]WRW00851.1 acetylornithine deacetylase [Grimontia sp. NTOU-MAR1]